MAEEIVSRGTSSQWKNFGVYILCALFCWLIVPIFIALARYLQTKNKVYELTTERLKITQGIVSKVTDTLELYRVKDLLVTKFGTRWKRFVREKACARSTSNNRGHASIVGGANLSIASIATSNGSRGRVVFPTIP